MKFYTKISIHKTTKPQTTKPQIHLMNDGPRCYNCSIDEDVEVRNIFWIVRPRAKNGGGSYHDIFDIKLCGFCYILLGGDDAYTIGWDWWDAADFLSIIDEKIEQARIDYWKRFKERGY